jgi:ABC-2 type transport system permease protein
MNFKRVAVYFPAFAKGYIRNPLGLFFALVFPIILILIFGAVFSNVGSSQVPLAVQNLDHNSAASQEFLKALNATQAVQVSFVSPTVGNLSNYLAQNNLEAGLVIPAGFGAALANHTPVHLLVFTNPAASSSTGLVLGAVGGTVNGVNLELANGQPLLSFIPLNVGSQLYTYVDYLIPGLIGFSVLVSPMFSMVNVSSMWRRDNLFRQLSLTPLTRSEWLTAALLWYIFLSVISAFLLVGVGKFLFGAHVTITWLVVPFLIVGPMLFVSLGLLAGSVSKTPESAAVIGNIITFPMMFLSGTFFPVADFPPYLQNVAHVLPLYYVIQGLNDGILFNNAAGAFQNALITLIIAVVFFVLAVRLFRWRDE